MRTPLALPALLAILVATASAAAALTPAEIDAIADAAAKGRAIATLNDEMDQGFGDTTAELEMVLTNASGDESRRTLRIATLEVPDPQDGDKTLVTFDEPRDVKGTALLTFAHIAEADDQWLFLPALKRVKRISSKNKSGPFVGSEFAYEDFAAQELEKYTYRWLRDEPCGDLACWVIERVPTYEFSGYTRQVVWMDRTDVQPRRIEFYDRKGDLLKTLTLGDYRRYLDQHWRAHDLFMENHQTGKTTRLTWSAFEFRSGLGESDFTQASLKRAR